MRRFPSVTLVQTEETPAGHPAVGSACWPKDWKTVQNLDLRKSIIKRNYVKYPESMRQILYISGNVSKIKIWKKTWNHLGFQTLFFPCCLVYTEHFYCWVSTNSVDLPCALADRGGSCWLTFVVYWLILPVAQDKVTINLKTLSTEKWLKQFEQQIEQTFMDSEQSYSEGTWSLLTVNTSFLVLSGVLSVTEMCGAEPWCTSLLGSWKLNWIRHCWNFPHKTCEGSTCALLPDG